MLYHIGRVATPKLVPRKCLRYLQTTLKMGGGVLVSEFMGGIADTRKLKENIFSLCHWNSNSITTYNVSKLTQLKAYISTYEDDFIFLSETYLEFPIPGKLTDIKRYNLVRADHPNNIKRGGVCIYYKESLPVSIKTLPYFKETIFFEMIYNNKKVIVSVIYRSLSQNNCELDLFLTNLAK